MGGIEEHAAQDDAREKSIPITRKVVGTTIKAGDGSETPRYSRDHRSKLMRKSR